MTSTSAHSFVAETIERRMQQADEKRAAKREAAALRKATKAAAAAVGTRPARPAKAATVVPSAPAPRHRPLTAG